MTRIIPVTNNIKTSRIHLGMSGSGLAKRIGASRQTISNIESGNSVYPATAKAICDVLEKPFEELFTIEEGE